MCVLRWEHGLRHSLSDLLLPPHTLTPACFADEIGPHLPDAIRAYPMMRNGFHQALPLRGDLALRS